MGYFFYIFDFFIVQNFMRFFEFYFDVFICKLVLDIMMFEIYIWYFVVYESYLYVLNGYVVFVVVDEFLVYVFWCNFVGFGWILNNLIVVFFIEIGFFDSFVGIGCWIYIEIVFKCV